MIRKLFLAIISVSLIASCASKKKAGEDGTGAGAGSEPAIGNQDMSFDPMGSDSGKIQGLNTIYFAYDQATLSEEAKRTLGANAEWIKGNPAVTVQIEGHTDERGSVEYNLSLGDRRAKSVRTYLSSLGVDPKRMTVISYGEEKPLEPKQDENSFSRNRRANFVPLPQ